jgi:hypothetical protein
VEQFDIVYDFGILEVIKKSWFVVIPVFIYWVAINAIRDNENEEESLIRNLFLQNESFDYTKAQIIKYAAIIFFVFLLVIQTVKTYQTYNNLNNGLKSIEGYVKNFHGMSSSGHDTERFNVKNVEFEFSDFDLSDFGYNNAKSKGGKIDENIYIRVHYYQSKNRNVIIKLEKRK